MTHTSSDTRVTRARRWTPVLVADVPRPWSARTPAPALQPRPPRTPRPHRTPRDRRGTPRAAARHPRGRARRPGTSAAHATAPAHGEGAGEHGEAHGESLGSFLSRIANFVILAGGLVYLLRSPLGELPRARAPSRSASTS